MTSSSELELFERSGDARAMVVRPFGFEELLSELIATSRILHPDLGSRLISAQCIADLRGTLYVAVPCPVRSDVGV